MDLTPFANELFIYLDLCIMEELTFCSCECASRQNCFLSNNNEMPDTHVCGEMLEIIPNMYITGMMTQYKIHLKIGQCEILQG